MFVINPAQPTNVNLVEKIENIPISDQVSVLETSTELVPADNTATKGRVIKSITNLSATNEVRIALGRTPVFATDFDLPVKPGVTMGDIPLGMFALNAICESGKTASVIITYSNYQ